MPTLNLVAELTIDDLLAVVSNLNEVELAEFEIRFEELWLSRPAPVDEEAAHLAFKQRLSPPHQARLRALLEKNREGDMTEIETEELDEYIAKIDQALEKTADDLLKLAKHRRQQNADEAQ